MCVEHTGILVIAHGSKNKKWVKYIDQTVASIHIHHPITVGFLEMVEKRSIEEGVRRLEKQQVKRIIVVPLFVSSGSTHLEEIQYALGLISTCRIKTDLKRIHPRAEIVWSTAMNDHQNMKDILRQRVQDLTTDPLNEALLLVGHGSKIAGFQHMWEHTLQSLTQSLKGQCQISEAQYATLLPDNVTERARILSYRKKLIVLPVFLSEGYFTTKVIPSKLTGLTYKYSGETYLPHPLVSQWIEEQILTVWRGLYEYVG
jgi:sirohydrochlorin cobaltochelatase